MTLALIAHVVTVVLAVTVVPRVLRLHRLFGENNKLRHEHDRLVRENEERAQQILERWTPRGGAN